MSHHIYTTSGFVVESYPHGEAGKFISIFTRDLGMIAGVAQGIRLSASKLRYHTQDFSLATFSLVRGKEVWRIIGAEQEKNAHIHRAISSPSTLFIQILKILKRLVAGEEKNEELFDVVLTAYYFLQKPELDQTTLRNAEYIIMLRILHRLGYIRSIVTLEPFLKDNSFTDELFQAMTPLKTIALKEINTALKESHL